MSTTEIPWGLEHRRMENLPKTGLDDDRLLPYLVECPDCRQPANRVCITPIGVPMPSTHPVRLTHAREVLT